MSACEDGMSGGDDRMITRPESMSANRHSMIIQHEIQRKKAARHYCRTASPSSKRIRISTIPLVMPGFAPGIRELIHLPTNFRQQFVLFM